MVLRSLHVKKYPYRPKGDNEEGLGFEVPYFSATDALMYLVNCNRSDIAFAMSCLASSNKEALG